jgi:hypothetical protein
MMEGVTVQGELFAPHGAEVLLDDLGLLLLAAQPQLHVRVAEPTKSEDVTQRVSDV